MAIRLVQKPDSTEAPFVLVYHSGASDDSLRRAAPGALICVDTGKGFSGYYGAIGPGKIDDLPVAIEKGAELAGVVGFNPTQVILAGWSEGCQGIRTQLKAGRMPDAVVAIDGTHSSKVPAPDHIDPWKDIISRAKRGAGAFLASCSSIEPGSYNSTRTTLRLLTGFDLERSGPVDDPAVYEEGNCVVWSCDGNTAQDHINQGQIVLPKMLAMAVTGGFSSGASWGSGSGSGLLIPIVSFLVSTLAGYGLGRLFWRR